MSSEQLMLSNDELLKSFVLEEGTDKSKNFLKVRLFPTDESLDNFVHEGPKLEHIDEFYDEETFEHAKRQEFVRTRGTTIVHQTLCTSLTVACHVYRERQISATPINTMRFLQYSFNRQQLKPRKNQLSLDAYLDTITSPFEYKVLSIRKPIEDIKAETIYAAFLELQEQFHCLWGDVLPVAFSKFMFSLLCLSTFEDLEEMFQGFEPVHEIVARNVEHLLLKAELRPSPQSIPRQLYIWTMQEQFESLFAMRHLRHFDDAACREQLEKLRMIVTQGTATFVRCDANDI